MLRTLHGKLAATLLLLLSLIALLLIPLTVSTTQKYLEDANQKLNRPLAGHVAEYLAAKNILRADARSLALTMAEIKRLMVINPDVEVYLLDVEGGIIAYSAAPGKVQSKYVSLQPLQRFLSRRDPAPVLGDDPRHPGERKIFSVASIPVQMQPQKKQMQGYVYIILGGDEHDSFGQLVQKSYILRLAVAATTGILLFVLLTGIFLFRFLTRPLRKLADAVVAFQQQIAPSSVQPYTGDEITRLKAMFHQMTLQIEAQVGQLKQADTHRREMVSNISHDLRTPLAALQGYLETLIIKEGHLTPDEQRTYLAIAARHGDRLNKLIADLFELARLDSHEAKAHPEPFSCGELVQDVIQKFQLTAENKQIKLATDFAPDLPFVCADIGLIERVLENLIENAARYTPAGGTITLALRQNANAIQVQITDTGSGIREEELPHIFERYYRVVNQPETPGSAGLGLAITKRILELHHSAIEVRSDSTGTTFSFLLPLAASSSQC